MSGLTSKAGLGVSDKLVKLTKHTRHAHIPSPVVLNFKVPPIQRSLSFNPLALAAAVARTATTWDDAPGELLDGLQRSALTELETLLQDGTSFALKSYFKFLADAAATQFAAKVGAGIAHLYMEALGYAWRANAVCLSSSLDPHADFIYDGGNAAGHGVVLAEAHGSFAKGLTAAKIDKAAKQKYIKQVKPYIAGPTQFGKVIHGYSIAFGSRPTIPESFLSVSETRISKPQKNAARVGAQGASTPDGPSGPIVLATHRSNFLLLDIPEVVGWIDWLRAPDASSPERHPVEFIRVRYGRQTYLAVPRWFSQSDGPLYIGDFFDRPIWWNVVGRARLSPSRKPGLDFGWFAIEERAGSDFLNALSNAIRGRTVPAIIRLPTLEPVGFRFGEGDRSPKGEIEGGYQYALFRDGLALLGDPFRGQSRGVVVWSPDEGITL